jgi:hypothetical protein
MLSTSAAFPFTIPNWGGHQQPSGEAQSTLGMVPFNARDQVTKFELRNHLKNIGLISQMFSIWFKLLNHTNDQNLLKSLPFQNKEYWRCSFPFSSFSETKPKATPSLCQVASAG